MPNSASRHGAPSCCPECEHCRALVVVPKIVVYPWRMTDRRAVLEYSRSLADEAREWLIAYFVNDELELLAADTIACGSVSSVRMPRGQLICRGRSMGATGFILVHNHPSGDSTPSKADIEQTVRLAQLSREMELPMLAHFVIASDGMREVGFW